MKKTVRPVILGAGLLVWACAAVAGMGTMMAAARTPDPAADAPAQWPAAITPPRPAPAHAVVCLHPKCPCSTATLEALADLAADSAGVAIDVLFAVPAHKPEWADADLVERARRVPGLNVVIDEDGLRAAALGARTSGQTFLYDAAGRLAFAGGLTPGRGESGPCDGLTALKSALAGTNGPTPVRTTPVFGCALYRSSTSEAHR
ncbi:MAG TPA: hypothetical protein VF595_17890 [Tepidisphaeraceae bacterium]